MPPNNNGLLTMENDCNSNSKRTIKYFSSEEVSKHDSSDDCWIIESDNVYDITEFLEKHPGGAELILSHGGKDVSGLLEDENFHNHSAAAFNLLKEYRVGKLLKSQNAAHHVPEEFSMNGWKEEMVDWNYGMVFQVHKFGADYMKWVNSPVNRKLRLFNSDFVEFFSKTPWYAIPIIWLPITMILAYLSLNKLYLNVGSLMFDTDEYFYKIMMTFLVFIFLFGAGLPLWSLVEYVLHRFLFHLEPKDNSPMLITFHFFLHGQHHKVPFDSSRLVFPPVAAAFFAYILYCPFVNLLPGGVGLALFSGGMLGYVIYDLMHYYLHHGSPKRGSYLHSLKYYHILHHFDDHSTGYGISTKFWDYPFATVNKKLI